MTRRVGRIGAGLVVALASVVVVSVPAGAGPGVQCAALGTIVPNPTGASLASSPFSCPGTSVTGFVGFTVQFTGTPNSLGTGTVVGTVFIATGGSSTGVTSVVRGAISQLFPAGGIPEDVLSIRGHGFDPDNKTDVSRFAEVNVPVGAAPPTIFSITQR